MIFTLTIAGVSKLLRTGSLHISKTANGRSTASFELQSEDRSYRAALDAEVIMVEDGVTIFGGLVDRPSERGLFGPLKPGIATTISAVDYHAYTERRFVNETIAAGTLKAALTTLVTNYLDDYGVTLDAGQVNGPNLPLLPYDYRRLDEVLNEFASLTAEFGEPYVWRITASKVLRMYQPSTVSAPFSLVGNDLPEVVGDIEVETSRGDNYANRIIIKVLPKTELGRIESFLGDGTPGPFLLQYTPTKLYGHILVQSGGGETLGLVGESPIQWSYDSVTNSITREAGNTTIGETYNLYFDGVFSGSWIAEDASEIAAFGLWERVLVVESITDDTTGQAFADSELAKRITETKTVRYRTWEQAIEPGQQQTINVSARNVNETGVITDVVIRDLVHRLERHVTAVVDDAQTNLGRGWRDVYKIWAGDKSGVPAAAVGTGGPSSGGPAPPFTSVQFNRDGAFGGDASFSYDEDTNSIVCGLSSSITAADHESCQVFGSDCHIAD